MERDRKRTYKRERNKHREKNNLKTERDQDCEKERYRNRAEKEYIRKLRDRLDNTHKKERDILTNKDRK
jgi:hypothetical protein